MGRGAGACVAALLAAAVALAAGVPACTTGTGKDEFEPRPQLPADRQLQTRRFEGISEGRLLAASIGVLQDLGFTVQISNAPLGMATGVKDREAKAPDQRAAVIVLMILVAATTGHAPAAVGEMKEEQRVRVLLTTRPVGSAPDVNEVRVTFHRFLRQPMMMEADSLRDPALYEGFFELLSRAIFLEAHRV